MVYWQKIFQKLKNKFPLGVLEGLLWTLPHPNSLLEHKEIWKLDFYRWKVSLILISVIPQKSPQVLFFYITFLLNKNYYNLYSREGLFRGNTVYKISWGGHLISWLCLFRCETDQLQIEVEPRLTGQLYRDLATLNHKLFPSDPF